MGEKKGTSGKKIGMMAIGSIIVASIFAVIVITIFYNTYDPSKYGRNNGGIDPDNKGVPEAQKIDEQSASWMKEVTILN